MLAEAFRCCVRQARQAVEVERSVVLTEALGRRGVDRRESIEGPTPLTPQELLSDLFGECWSDIGFLFVLCVCPVGFYDQFSKFQIAELFRWTP